jgi:hypothetical protein
MEAIGVGPLVHTSPAASFIAATDIGPRRGTFRIHVVCETRNMVGTEPTRICAHLV